MSYVLVRSIRKDVRERLSEIKNQVQKISGAMEHFSSLLGAVEHEVEKIERSVLAVEKVLEDYESREGQNGNPPV